MIVALHLLRYSFLFVFVKFLFFHNHELNKITPNFNRKYYTMLVLWHFLILHLNNCSVHVFSQQSHICNSH